MQEANKPNNFADQNWYELLTLAYNRCGQNARRLSKELSIPFTTLLSWLSKKKEPRSADELKEALLVYFEKPFVCGVNPNVLARIWQTMRCMRKFSAAEIVSITGASADYCRQVIRLMCRCNYLRLVAREPRIFILVRDTGPRPPAMNKKRTALIDNNTEQEVAA